MGNAILYARLMLEAKPHPVCGGLTCDRATTRGGYIQMWGKPRTYAHRVTWEAHNGPIPDGMKVCHRCDEPACYEIRHLFLGTVADNNADRDAKDRGVVPDTRGIRHGMHRLTETEVLAIFRDTRPIAEVAAEFRTAKSNVSKIRNRKAWKHLTADL